MTESQFQTKLLTALRRHPKLQDAVIWKLNDRYTRGIPDLLIALHGVTTYFELKKFPEQPTKIQQYFLERLAPRSWVITFMRGDATLMVSGAKGNQFVLRNDTFAQTIIAIVARCVDAQKTAADVLPKTVGSGWGT